MFNKVINNGSRILVYNYLDHIVVHSIQTNIYNGTSRLYSRMFRGCRFRHLNTHLYLNSNSNSSINHRYLNTINSVVVMFTYQYRSAVPSNQPSKSSNNSRSYCDKTRGSMAGQCTHRYLCMDAK